MTRCPTTLESQVWRTPRTPVAIAIAIRPPTSRLSSRVSRSGKASSKIARMRKAETAPREDEKRMSASTVPKRRR
jgi:hypothetical protein